MAATGDQGSPGYYPAYSPNVLAVGGSTLNLNPNGTYQSETAWSGSGGGTSGGTRLSRPIKRTCSRPDFGQYRTWPSTPIPTRV